MFTNIQYKTYAVYSVFLAVMLPAIYFFYPETGSRSLEEIDLLFEGATTQGNPWFSVVHVAKQEPRWFDVGEEKAMTYSSTDSSTEPYSEHVFPTKPRGPLNGHLSSDGSI